MKKKYIEILLMVALLITGTLVPVYADDDDENESRGYRPVENTLYKQECSSCHFLFLPGLLTANSWEAVIKSQEKHFGENLGLDVKTQNGILEFLKNNSAEKTGTEWGRKITRSSGSTAYTRITEVPWIVKEHRKISSEVFKRPSIGSRSNCEACHQSAAQGNFEEDAVVIPQK